MTKTELYKIIVEAESEYTKVCTKGVSLGYNSTRVGHIVDTVFKALKLEADNG